jgi:serine/threonine protein kinase
MSIAAGSHLGPYEIVAPAGAGGMGEVWRARDTRLDRTVAIKVLPAHLSSNSQYRARFDREAKAISSLTHAHICTLYDVGHEDGIDYLVMEFVEGESLADRLTRGAMPVEQVLRYGIEIAEALDKAHRLGITHRDLKPSNIMLTKSGAKLIDFGLAKLRDVHDGSEEASGATSNALTAEGFIIGTVQYMAPEQLQGYAADARADIFSYGAVMYEMATGRKAFEGKTKSSLAAAIVTSDPPPIPSIQPLTPPALDRVVRTCLAKDPDDRWQSAHDIASELRWIQQAGSGAGVAAPVVKRRKVREGLAWTIAAIGVLAALVMAAEWLRSRPPLPQMVKTSILPPENSDFDFQWGSIALSPDGRRLAFLARGTDGKRMLWIRPLDDLSAKSLAGTEDATYPFWSPDSRYLGFFAGRKLKRIDAAGGPAQTLCDAKFGRGGAWSRNGVIVFTPAGGPELLQISASGGQPIMLRKANSSNPDSFRWPSFLPDDQHVLILERTALPSGGSKAAVCILSTETGEVTRLFDSDFPAVYAAPGYLLFRREKSLFAQPFDAQHLRLTGEAFPVAEEIRTESILSQGVFSVSGNGLLAFQTGVSELSQLMWVDRTGAVIAKVGPPANYRMPSVSHDGRKVAVAITDPAGTSDDIWIIDLARGVSSRLTSDPNRKRNPHWSPDDTRVFFTSGRSDVPDQHIHVRAVSGLGSEEELASMPGFQIGTQWSSDGRYIAFTNMSPALDWDLWLYSIAEKKAFPLLKTSFDEGTSYFSPDGKWFVYASDESGRYEVYVQSFPSSGQKWQVSSDGGLEPRWSPAGNEIFFLSPNSRLMSAAVKARGATFETDVPKTLFEIHSKGGRDTVYDVAPDGQRFLINSPIKERTPITLVLNWAAGR